MYERKEAKNIPLSRATTNLRIAFLRDIPKPRAKINERLGTRTINITLIEQVRTK